MSKQETCFFTQEKGDVMCNINGRQIAELLDVSPGICEKYANVGIDRTTIVGNDGQSQ